MKKFGLRMWGLLNLFSFLVHVVKFTYPVPYRTLVTHTLLCHIAATFAMTVTVRKAGEAAAKAATQRLRAVTAAEAPHVVPARASTQQTLEPWRGWFQRFLKEQMGDDRYEKFRGWTNFMPDDLYDGQPMAVPSQKVPISRTDPTITAMYRYPSPGSQEPARMPSFEKDEDPYDSGYFKRDTRRRHLFSELGEKDLEMAKLDLMDPNDPDVQEDKARVEEGPASSPGNGGRFATGPSDFDPSGLRATMSVSWKSLDESLDANMPDHLPTAIWEGREEETIKFYEERDLPVPVGEYYDALKTPINRRVATW